ncbi:putative protein OS=Streptomyces antimycoticus OX=68175 GN=SSPO_048670 PE=4 SV=1 [Streptomyces antimycoticus]
MAVRRRALLRRHGVRLGVLRLHLEELQRVPSEPGEQPARQPGLAVVGHRLGGGDQFVHRGPLGRVLVQACGDQPARPLGEPHQIGLLLGYSVHQGVDPAVHVAERLTSGGGEGEHRAQAEDIARGGDRLAAHLLGRHETGRADDRAGHRQIAARGGAHGVQGARDAEVDNARTVDGDEDVGRLEIAVDQPGAVDVAQREGQSVRQDPQRALGQRTEVLGDDAVQGRTADVAGGHPGHLGVGVGVEHGGGPLAADPCGRLHLPLEAAAEVGLSCEFGLYELHRYGAAAGGAGEIDPAHSALAELAEQPVLADPPRVLGPEVLHRGVAPVPVPIVPAPIGRSVEAGERLCHRLIAVIVRVVILDTQLVMSGRGERQ